MNKYLINFNRPFSFSIDLEDSTPLSEVPNFPKVTIYNIATLHKLLNRSVNINNNNTVLRIDNIDDPLIQDQLYTLSLDNPTIGFMKLLFYGKRNNKPLINLVSGIGVAYINKIIKALAIINTDDKDHIKLRYHISTQLDEIIHKLDNLAGDKYIEQAEIELEKLLDYIRENKNGKR